MKAEETVQYMTKMYLERIIKSLTQDYPSNKDAEEYREIVKNNLTKLSSRTDLNNRLNKFISTNQRDPYANRLLYDFILRSILSKPDFIITQEEINEFVISKEKEILHLSEEPESFRHIDENNINIFSAILETALEDGTISTDELRLIIKLRKKLSISEKDQYLIQAKLGLFPSADCQVHTSTQVSKGIDDLQKCGIIFYCNQYEDSSKKVFVIPDELADSVKAVLGIELIKYKYVLLLQRFQNKQLQEVLRERNLYVYGTKNEMIERIIHSGIKPSEALETITTTELSDICSKIPSLNVSGKKEEKISRLIKYYSKLIIKSFKEDNTDQKYYEYLEELAIRDIDNLLGNEIIKDHDYIDKAFEDGTKYLFREKFNIPLIEFSGNEHADGGVVFETGDSILLWDNKSRKNGEPYKFPDKHLRQFLRYINKEKKKGRRVSCFLIVTDQIDPIAEKNAVKLKAQSGVDTDVAVVSAENLKLVAEIWQKHSSKEKFNLHILNITGILNWENLRERMSWHE
ncbi:MAG: hypothetical protein FH748_13480 [Balneolaceae bacterium]|nr:hypothetical protein [Balneolaceae bacterium]